tara:strand:+ start:212 stop:397 length:186 start_codon:yes stop_codon:yes gene_type:complete
LHLDGRSEVANGNAALHSVGRRRQRNSTNVVVLHVHVADSEYLEADRSIEDVHSDEDGLDE